MMTKKNERGKCPFRDLKPCSDECVLYRKGMRFKEGSLEPIPFEECAINVAVDNIEVMHGRTVSLQQEVGDAKNIMALKILVDVGNNQPEHLDMLQRHIRNILSPPDPAKQIKG